MKIHYIVPGKKRKELAHAIGSWIGADIEYAGAPTFDYHIDTAILDKDGNLTFEGLADTAKVEQLQAFLKEEGFECDQPEDPTPGSDGFAVSIPLEKAAVGNLTNLLQAKGTLIKKALGVTDICIEVKEDRVAFPWFDTIPTPEEIDAYSKFITALCKMSVRAKRIFSVEKAVDNEKYAFRCFLLRLGFIGPEYKDARKILLRNLTGSSAFKSGKRKEPQDQEAAAE